MADDDTNAPSGEDPNEGSAGGIGVGESGANPPPPTPNWREFLDGIDKLNSSLGEKLDGIKGTVQENTRPPPPQPPDYEGMSNVELVAHVTGSVQQMVQQAIQQALKPITDQMTSVQNEVVTTKGQITLKEMQAQHKDLSDWKDEMIALVGRHPTLSLQEVYQLARAGNNQKARQLDQKYNPPPPKPRPYGGLVPGANGAAREPVLNGEAATKAAYREVSERHPGILPLLQEL